MTKVYLAKSNRANPNKVSKIREHLKSLGLTVVEFNGGKYSNKPLLECDYLVVVPEYKGDDDLELEIMREMDIDTYVAPLGRGLYEQISDFTRVKSKEKVLIFYESDNEIAKSIYESAKYIDLEMWDSDDYFNYGYCVLEEDDTTMSEFFKNVLTTTSNNYKYLLTKR
jgi:hypothetical protein